MARLNINLSDSLDKKMRAYLQENDLTITTFLHLAITKYIDSQEQERKWEGFFTTDKKEVKKMI